MMSNLTCRFCSISTMNNYFQVWPLTTVKRWAASPNSFTLDFGDYSDQFYSVKTPEGEQIAQLIAGYIDIILKRQKAKDHIGIEGDEGSTMVEESVSPAKASTIQLTPAIQPVQPELQNIAIPSVVRPSPESEKIGLPGHVPISRQKTETGTLTQGQRVQNVSDHAYVDLKQQLINAYFVLIMSIMT